MIRTALLSAALALAVTSAFAQETRCDPAPYAPNIPSGKTATKEQMLTAHDAVQEFIKLSDQYQECLMRDLNDQKATLARKSKPETIDQKIVDVYKVKGDTNQREKERLGAEFNAAVVEYKTLHPEAPKPAPK